MTIIIEDDSDHIEGAEEAKNVDDVVRETKIAEKIGKKKRRLKPITLMIFFKITSNVQTANYILNRRFFFEYFSTATC